MTSITITVSDIDKAIQEVIVCGRNTSEKEREIWQYGHVAYVKDTEGNVLGLWQSLRTTR